ncbi:DUF6656 family protein [Hoeflea sp.]|uniref:DUF6656 family protein n=1 Tax=Hoeflea sp. TaxID=1940281 RepID=UPI003B5197BC
MSMFRYYAAKAKGEEPAPVKAVHTNFLRTGRIAREGDSRYEEPRRYLSNAEVAKRTGIRLEKAGRKAHERLNRFHRDFAFPEIIFHKTLTRAPHLGYVHVTASKTDFADFKDVNWGFYIANFAAEITDDEQFFARIHPGYSRMYFAVALKEQEDGETSHRVINRDVRDNGLLFRTDDPRTALRNVLLLGARNAELRRIVKAIG